MNFIAEDLEKYACAHTRPQIDVLKRLERETFAKVLMPRMLSGHIQGELLRMISCMIKPERILEIGTYTGYSAICLSDGLIENGKLVSIDINEELESFVRKFFREAGVENKIDYIIGNAIEIIPQLNEVFDLVFIDADKINYDKYFELVISKTRKGGFILADNVLWSGKVLDEKKDKDTEALHQFNKKVSQDERVESLLLPVRDGIMILRKK